MGTSYPELSDQSLKAKRGLGGSHSMQRLGNEGRRMVCHKSAGSSAKDVAESR